MGGLLFIFLGVGMMVVMISLADTYSKTRVLEAKRALAKAEAEAKAQASAETLPPPTDPNAAPTLALRLPEPLRAQAWALTCRVHDGLEAQGDTLEPRARFTLEQALGDYLPQTLQAFFALDEGGRRRLAAQGMNAETLLAEQLDLIAGGVDEALSSNHAAADRLLTQGRFLRERFAGSAGATGVQVPTLQPERERVEAEA